MKIVVLPKYAAEIFKCEEPWAAISIASFGASFPDLSTVNRVGLLQLDFYDVNTKIAGSFTEDQAVEILRFAQEIVPKIEILMVHCDAGVSRSPATTAALCKLMGNDDSYYFKRYIPNTLVYGTILKVAHEQGITLRGGNELL